MATESAPPPLIPPTEDKPQNSASELAQPSAFVNSEPIREDQVQNAIKFLSHPKVKGTPVIYRRSFLEKKGLTKEEIDEAFRRVPDPSANGTSVDTTSTNQEGQLKSASNVQLQAPTQNRQHGVPGSKTGLLTEYRFHWSHAFLAVGLLAASGAGTAVLIKNTIIPRLKSWIREIVLEEDGIVKKTDLKPSLMEEATTAAKAAASAAADAAEASHELLHSKNAEKKHFEELKNLLSDQGQAIKSVSNAIHKLEGQRSTYEEPSRIKVTSKQKPILKYSTVTYPSPPPPVPLKPPPPPPPHPESYIEIIKMIQKGQKPDNIRKIDDMPPNPNQEPSKPQLEPKTKPWESAEAENIEVFRPMRVDTPEPAEPWSRTKTPQIGQIPDDDQVTSRVSDGVVELQRIQKISESGGESSKMISIEA